MQLLVIDNNLCKYTFKHTKNFHFMSISVKSYISKFHSSLVFQTMLVDSDVMFYLIFWYLLWQNSNNPDNISYLYTITFIGSPVIWIDGS